MRVLLITTILILASASAQTTDPAQEDGGVPGDAPDVCEVDERRQLVVDGDHTHGILIPEDDEVDYFHTPLGEDRIGHRLSFHFEGVTFDPWEIGFDIVDADCGESVFDVNASFYQPDPARLPPETPIEAEPGQQILTLLPEEIQGADRWICKSEHWRLKLDIAEASDAPASIYVEWTDGHYEYVDAWKTSNEFADYVTTSHRDVTIAQMQLAVPEDFAEGEHFMKGPCHAADGERPLDPRPPVSHAHGGEFTLTQAGSYRLIMNITKGPSETTQETLLGLIQDPPQSMPASCHRVCPGLDSVSYEGELVDLGDHDHAE